jgi:hypothetical protein
VDRSPGGPAFAGTDATKEEMFVHVITA